MRWHPDKNLEREAEATAMMQRLVGAWEVLKEVEGPVLHHTFEIDEDENDGEEVEVEVGEDWGWQGVWERV